MSSPFARSMVERVCVPADSLVNAQPFDHRPKIFAEPFPPEWLLALHLRVAKTQSPGWL